MHKSTRPPLRSTHPSTGGKSIESYLATLVQHDAEIVNLSARMTGVESSIDMLKTEVTKGFLDLSVKFDKVDNRPQFDFQKTISTVMQIAVLFSMTVGGIIYITTNQFAPLSQKVDRNEAAVIKMLEGLSDMREKIGWSARVEPDARRR